MTNQKVSDEAILDFIRTHNETHPWPPSIRDIGRAVGLKSPDSVNERLRKLISDGRLERLVIGNVTRILRIKEV